MKTTDRNLRDVVDEILALTGVPDDLAAELDKAAVSWLYSPPELSRERWNRVAAALNGMDQEMPCAADAYRIFAGEELASKVSP